MKIVFTLTMLLLFSCKKQKPESVGFSTIVNVGDSLDSIQTEPVLLLVRYLVSTAENVVALGADENLLFNVFDAHTGEYKGGFGREGEGPDEFMHVFPSGFSGFGSRLSIGDFNSIRVISDFDEQVKNIEEIKPSRTIRYPEGFIPMNSPFFLNDSTVCGQTEFSDKQLSCFFSGTLKTFGLIDYPVIRDRVAASANHHLYQNHVKITPDQKKIVFAYSFFPMIKIYDIATQAETDIHYKSKHEQKEKVEVAPHNKSVNILDLFSYYSNIAVSDNFIYAFYQEAEFVVSRGNPEIFTKPLSDKEIHVFSMEGDPVVKIILEDWMKVFTSTQDDSFLYFAHPEKEDYLFRFSLQDVIP